MYISVPGVCLLVRQVKIFKKVITTITAMLAKYKVYESSMGFPAGDFD
jgi:hypothetical protein